MREERQITSGFPGRNCDPDRLRVMISPPVSKVNPHYLCTSGGLLELLQNPERVLCHAAFASTFVPGPPCRNVQEREEIRTLAGRPFGPKRLACVAMAKINDPPKTIGEIIDHIERIKEELLMVQRSMEKIESVKPALPRPRLLK